MPTYKFNDKQGNRDRICAVAVILDGEACSLTEAKNRGWAAIQESNRVKSGKWSHSDYEVTVNNARLVVFMEPFEGWPRGSKSKIIACVQESCTQYIGYAPTESEAWLAFESAFGHKMWFAALTEEVAEHSLA